MQLTNRSRVAVIDFDGMKPTERQRNFINRAGSKIADTEERKRQDERESETPMAIYDELSDIPPSPAEPADSDNDEFTPEIMFGPPPKWVTVSSSSDSSRDLNF